MIVKEPLKKRGSRHTELVLTELETCAPSSGNRGLDDQLALADILNRFLESLPPQTRRVFMRRHWYFDPIREIAKANQMTEGQVKMLLLRTRRALRKRKSSLMKTDSIAYALGYVDERYVTEAALNTDGKPQKRRFKWGAVAACFVLAIVLGATAAFAAGLLDPLFSE